MTNVKAYHNVNAKNEQVSFAVSKMEDVYRLRNGLADEPHRHDFFTVLIIESAKGVHKIDFNSYELDHHQIYFVSPGQVHQVIEEEPSKGYAITFSEQFLIENSIHLSFIEGLNLFHDYGQSPPLIPNESQYKKLAFYAKEVFKLFKGTSNMKELSIGAFLKLFLIECNNVCEMTPVDLNLDISENRIISEFKKEVNIAYLTEHSTSYYANRLYITPDHLNRVVKSAIGKTAKEYIQSRLITEAKRLLYFSGLSTKEIAFQLGFHEPANFSTFFKKHTKVSPSNFKIKENVH